MAEQRLLDVLARGASAWNELRRSEPDLTVDLKHAKLRRANLADMDLSYANLYRADLRGADLSRADLRDAILGDAAASRSKMVSANISNANMWWIGLWEAGSVPSSGGN
jgi:hypothetical protein